VMNLYYRNQVCKGMTGIFLAVGDLIYQEITFYGLTTSVERRVTAQVKSVSDVAAVCATIASVLGEKKIALIISGGNLFVVTAALVPGKS
jgi:hypothetical protein